MAQRKQAIQIFAPTAGRKHDAPSTLLDPRSQNAGKNGKMFYGVNQKEYGTSLYATGSNIALGAVGLIFNVPFTGGSSLQVVNSTGVFKYSSTADSFIVDGQTLTATYTDFPFGLMYNGQFFFTNGVDPIQVKADLSATSTDMASALFTNTYKAWALSGFREHLNLYHTVENGSEFPARVRWTKKGVLTLTASATDFASGTAGAIDLPDVEGEIVTASPLGNDTHVVYANRSIHQQVWVGGDEIYRFSKAISGIGTPSRRGVVSFGGVQYFIGNESFYAYYGGNDYRDIGLPVRAEAFREINNSQIGTAIVEYDNRDREVWFHIPVGTDTSPSVVWVYRLENESWSRLERGSLAAGDAVQQRGISWGELVGSWGSQTIKWGDYILNPEALVKLYSDPSGRIVKKDQSRYSLSVSGTSVAQPFIYETPDIVMLRPDSSPYTDPYDKSPVEYTTTIKRFLQANLELVGTGSSSVLYSTDGGSNFVEFPASPVTLAATGTTHTLDLDVSAEMLRLRTTCTGTNDNMGVKYIKIEFLAGSEQR